MYKKPTVGWFKHFDFIVLDMLCLQLAFVLSYMISGNGTNPYSSLLYGTMAVLLECIDLVVLTGFDVLKNVLKRGYYTEFIATLRHTLVVAAVAICVLFVLKRGSEYSRLSFGLMLVIYFVLAYVVRELWKLLLKKHLPSREHHSLLIATTAALAPNVVRNLKKESYLNYKLMGLVIMDRNMTGETIGGVPVVADMSSAAAYVCQSWVDEVLIIPEEHRDFPSQLVDQLEETGVTTHVVVAKLRSKPGKRQMVERIGPYTVATTSMNYASVSQLILKRAVDIVGGFLGCLMTGILFLFVAPAIYISSPGPIFFSQERVGKNGKKFKMYKFRSMYMDAEARKAELMKQNKLGDGKMFKMDFDPRVIGNRVLPDGTHKTGIGEFIRKTSIDEFPQFFNVLKGDMSIVGTRPPLPGEVSLYELHHRAQLAIKPGITGLWQVSGRSDITDFEEVVDLDKQYINSWNIEMDIKILLKTVLVVFKRDGSV